MQLRATRLTAIASAVKRAIKAFSPAQLFGTGAPGVWYDPSDMSTLFQDVAGTTPVTSVEQPVGLMLDKSQGLVLGSELVMNGDGSAGLTGWTTSTWTVNGSGQFTASTGTLLQTGVVTVGKWYVMEWDQIGPLTNTLNVFCGVGNVIAFTTASPAGRKSLKLVAAGDTRIIFQANGANTTIDNISVKELAGNHAFQATNASRPVLSARYNLLTKTEQFDDAAWTKTNVTAVNTTATTDPLGGNTADYIKETGATGVHLVLQGATVGANVQGRHSVYMKAAQRTWAVIFTESTLGGGSGVWFNLADGTVGTQQSGATGAIVAVVDGWYLCSVTATLSTTIHRMYAGVASADNILSYTGDGTSGIYIWGASLVPANQSTLPYQRVNTATDYNTTGFLPFLKFDGIDDSLSTNSISFTSTDKVSVFAGVRKLSDAAPSILTELSSSWVVNAGTFVFVAPDGVGTFSSGSRGDATASLNQVSTASPYVSPITNVLASLHDIAADLTTLRVNTVAATSATGDKGTGNYGNYPLYIGRRNNASLPFNGQLYSMIIVGKAVTAGELSSTETYVNSKTKAY